MSIVIREAKRSDIPAVAELFDLYRQFYEQPADLSLAQQFMAERVNKRESVVLLAETDAAGLVGFCQLYPSYCSVEAEQIYVLYDLYVLPHARASGVGRMLLLAAEAPGASISTVARQHGLNASMLFQWRRTMAHGESKGLESGEEVVPVSKLRC